MNIFLYFLASLKVLIKFVRPIFTELITVTSFFLRSGVNKNKGIMKTAYQIAHSGPTILMCSYSLVFKPYKFSVSPPGQTNIIKNKINAIRPAI